MKSLRSLLALVATVLMVGGYAASQMAFFQGTTANYIQQLDGSAVPWLALVLLIGIVVLGCLPEGDDEVSA